MPTMTLSNSMGKGYVMNYSVNQFYYFSSAIFYSYSDRTVKISETSYSNPYGINRVEVTTYTQKDLATINYYGSGSTPLISISGTRAELADWSYELSYFVSGNSYYLDGDWTIIGTKYSDTLLPGNAKVTLYGNDGNDTLKGGYYSDIIYGGTGNDQIWGDFHDYFDGDADRIYGDAGNDRIYGSTGDDTIYGGVGDDKIWAHTSSDTSILDSDKIYGGDGSDYIVGGWYNQAMDDSRYSQMLSGGNGSDTIYGKWGRDSIYGDAGDDLLYAGADNDLLYGGTGNDLLESDMTKGGSYEAERDADTFYGGEGNDTLRSGIGNDRLFGQNGSDTLNGEAGLDTLTGSGGADIFVFNSALGSSNIDRITDFNVVDDTIHVESAIFKGLTSGRLAATAFVKNTSGDATDASDRIIYESDTGKLFYDPDGTGGAKKIQFAVLNAGLNLTSTDFIVI